LSLNVDGKVDGSSEVSIIRLTRHVISSRTDDMHLAQRKPQQQRWRRLGLQKGTVLPVVDTGKTETAVSVSYESVALSKTLSGVRS